MAVELYSDLNAGNPEEGNLVLGVDAVFAAMDNLFSTDRDERPFNLDFSGNIDDLLFEDLDFGTALELYSRMAHALERFEPRIRLIENLSNVTVNDEQNGYDIVLTVSVLGYEEAGTRVYRAFVSRLD